MVDKTRRTSAALRCAADGFFFPSDKLDGCVVDLGSAFAAIPQHWVDLILYQKEHAMDRAEKEALIEELKEDLGGASVLLVTRQSGMTVTEAIDLRTKMRESGSTHRVAKNRLVKLAVEGTPFEGVSDLLTGPTSLTYSEDPVAPAKVIVDYIKANPKMEIVGGAMDGKPMDAAGVEALSKLPSKDELRAKIAGLLKAPAAKIAGALEAAPIKVIGVLKAREDQLKEAA